MNRLQLQQPKMYLLLITIVCLFFLLCIRLIDLQLIQGSIFRAEANENRLFTQQLPAERGIFFDRFGKPLVYNNKRYYALEKIGQAYSPRVRIDRQDALQRMATSAASVTYEIERQYTFPEAIAHVLGYTGAVTAEDLSKDQSLQLTDSIGKMGLEYVLNDQLRGRSGFVEFEIDALGLLQRVLRKDTGISGKNFETTIDPYLSQVAYESLEEKRGVVIILDAQTGGVLSLISTPTFNPNVMSATQVNQAEELARKTIVSDYFSHPQKLFFNRAISGAYPPGSVFKLVTALAGLESNAVTPDTTVQDEGILTVGEYTYANWFYTQYGGVEGTVSLQRAIARSNDIYFYKAAEWIGPDTLARFGRLFGFGSPTGIEISGEVSGTVPDPAWKERVVGERWFLGNTYHFGIGQGDLLVTPLQIAQLTQALSNNGTLCQPHTLAQSDPSKDGNHPCAEVGVAESNLDLVLQGMIDACSQGGTGFPFFSHNASINVDGLSTPNQKIDAGLVACKTGTAEFGAVDSKGFKSTHGWFTGIISIPDLENVPEASESASIYGTVDRNQWVDEAMDSAYPTKVIILALVESDESQPYREGSRDAGPIVRKIFDFIYGNTPEEIVIDGIISE